MNSFFGKMLVIDLSTKRSEVRPVPSEWAEKYFGQKGMGARIIMEDVPPDTDPLSPENELVFTTSVMAGTIVSCSAKLAISCKSPQTGTITDGSVGGHTGAELKYAGYDAVAIKGKADKLSYVYIDPDTVEVRDASALQDAGTFDTESRLKEEIGDEKVKILAIGPAGERCIPFACVSSERYRQLGRGGVGAVFGSKNLKAVAIRGWLDVHVPDIEACMKAAAAAHEQDDVISEDNEIYEFGTPVLVDFSQESGLLPTNNFQTGRFDGYKNINGESLKAVRQNKKACFSCGISCGNYVSEGQSRVEGPEYETIALCGSSIGNGDREKLIEINAICDDFGLDTISTGGVIACMMELTERGIHDFGIRFGETEKALTLIRDIAFKQGAGAEAALGSKPLAEKYGAPDYAMAVKGMELPGYDPRGSWGMGIAYATAPRGGCHMSAYPIALEAWGELDPFTFEGKGKLVAEMQDAQFAKFSMGICDFWPIESDTLGKLFEVTYGGSWPAEKVDRGGERIFNLQRVYNVMAGFTDKEDTLPRRFFKELLKEGPPKDHPMTEEAFRNALAEYYASRGWDEQGRPTVEKLRELGMEEELVSKYADYLGLAEKT
jgi:aldehyde:ferredoxin oxidoreductase